MNLFEKDNYASYYIDISVTDEYIYLLKNASKTLYEDEGGMTAQIEVLNWEGVPQAVYEISSNYDLSVFAVNEEDLAFYGLNYTNDSLYKFNYGTVD